MNKTNTEKLNKMRTQEIKAMIQHLHVASDDNKLDVTSYDKYNLFYVTATKMITSTLIDVLERRDIKLLGVTFKDNTLKALFQDNDLRNERLNLSSKGTTKMKTQQEKKTVKCYDDTLNISALELVEIYKDKLLDSATRRIFTRAKNFIISSEYTTSEKLDLLHKFENMLIDKIGNE